MHAPSEATLRVPRSGLPRCSRAVEANVVTYSSVISAYARVGDKAGAERCLAKMLEGGIEADNICYNAVIDACAKAKHVTGAEKWMAKMKESGLQMTTVTYNAVINACAKSGDAKRSEM